MPSNPDRPRGLQEKRTSGTGNVVNCLRAKTRETKTTTHDNSKAERTGPPPFYLLGKDYPAGQRKESSSSSSSTGDDGNQTNQTYSEGRIERDYNSNSNRTPYGSGYCRYLARTTASNSSSTRRATGQEGSFSWGQQHSCESAICNFQSSHRSTTTTTAEQRLFQVYQWHRENN